MREALALAQDRLGLTTPNPSVGCVIVRGDRVVGRGVKKSERTKESKIMIRNKK